MKIASVELTEQESTNNSLLDNSTKVFFKCTFCEKETKVFKKAKNWLSILSPNNHHCTFCVRNDYHTKKNQNVLIASFRAVIGYIYYYNYRIPYLPTLYLCELKEMVDMHKKIGLMNPAFNYDDESFCWFVDFSKVGKSKKKIRVECVKNTFSEILTAFNMFEYIGNLNLITLVERYHEAIDTFYTSRTRPEDKKLLIPTLKGCADLSVKVSNLTNNHATKKIPIEECRNFLPSMMLSKPKF